jgi:hypothetical protein
MARRLFLSGVPPVNQHRFTFLNCLVFLHLVFPFRLIGPKVTFPLGSAQGVSPEYPLRSMPTKAPLCRILPTNIGKPFME